MSDSGIFPDNFDYLQNAQKTPDLVQNGFCRKFILNRLLFFAILLTKSRTITFSE